MNRIENITSLIDKCNVFADVGCDHGYCTKYVLDNNLCNRAIIADVSAPSLSKAERLLSNYILSGKCYSVCCSGLSKIQEEVDSVLIAGMGGEEIIGILKESYIPNNFVFQPMKNAPELRKFLLESGCAITYDNLFYCDKKYYFIIKGSTYASNNAYTPDEIEYGRDSLSNPLLKDLLTIELNKCFSYLSSPMKQQSKQEILERIKRIQGVINAIGK